MILSEADAQALSQKILALSKADSCIVTLGGADSRHVRFAQNMATTNGSPSSIAVSVESHFGMRSGSASGTDLGDAALAALVAESENTARLAPENPEFMPPIGPQKYLQGTDFSPATASATSAMLAAAVRPVLQQAQEQNLQASGFLDAGAGFSSFANSKGLFVYDQSTDVLHTVTARTPDGTGSGWAGTTHSDFSKMDIASLGATAIDKAIRSRKPAKLPPGKYTVILEPSAVSDLICILIGDEFDQRSADEGRNFATKMGGGSRVGEQVFGKNVTIYSDPNDPLVPGSIYSDDGLPAQRTSWIENGILKNLQCGRYWAQKTEARSGADADLADHGGRDDFDRRHDQAGEAWAADHALLVHPRGGPADGAAHRPDARRRVPDRERRDHAPFLQFPLQRESRGNAEQSAGHGAVHARLWRGDRGIARCPRGGAAAAGR